MRLPGPLIEYIINGSVAIIWVFPWIEAMLPKVEGDIVILVPIIYVLGMFIDLLAFGITKPAKSLLRENVEKRYLGETQEYYPGIGKEMKIKVLTKYPELAKEIEMRSGRDRIARGMIVNSIFFLFFPELIPVWLSTVLFVLSIIMWVAFEYASHGFIIHAYRTSNESDKKITAR